MGFGGTELGKDCERFLQAIASRISALRTLEDEAKVVETPRLAVAVSRLPMDRESLPEVVAGLLKAP